MDRQYGEFVGVDKVYTAIITEDSEASYVTESNEYFAPTAEISAESEIENTPTYYDNVPGFNYVSEGVTTLTITFSGVPADKYAKYLGKHYDAATGRVYDTGEPVPPDVALAFRFNKGPADYRYYQYLKGNFSGGTEEASSKTNSVDIRTYQMTYTAVATTHKWSINGEEKPLKRILADTTDLAFVGGSAWFSQVQTPDTATPPTALTLSSSLPADEATGVNVSSSITLTFSNKIAKDTIVLIDSTDGEPVPAAKTWDVTGKILTLTPASNLEEGTKYIVLVSGVVDVFGQALTASGITFTTA
ncbi:MAG TPA: hypothetical protein GX523_15345 [Desulfitobacterium dehalogenans]|uniref:SbsA Ig-like domain-containing protein n=1 Tax=Desulfitobacterium dehalogenans TaxID=36854 RepID=A0A7C6Z671_9FIRM|nr:hypothetical protein [Desulfitobacterium dehalogenans]